VQAFSDKNRTRAKSTGAARRLREGDRVGSCFTEDLAARLVSPSTAAGRNFRFIANHVPLRNKMHRKLLERATAFPRLAAELTEIISPARFRQNRTCAPRPLDPAAEVRGGECHRHPARPFGREARGISPGSHPGQPPGDHGRRSPPSHRGLARHLSVSRTRSRTTMRR